jgi:hypothetical protein
MFQNGLPPSGARTYVRGGFPGAALHPLSRGAGNTTPYQSQILLATNGQVHHSNGQDMPVLPAGQGPHTYPAPASRHTGTLPLHSHTRRSCWTAATLARQHIPVHCDRQDVDTTESPFPSFLEELQTAMASRSPPPTRHNSSLAPTTLLAVLLLACFLLVLLRREAAAAGTPLRRTLRFPGAVNTLFPPADRGPNRQGLHAPPQACPDTRRHRAGTATMQGETRCTGVT